MVKKMGSFMLILFFIVSLVACSSANTTPVASSSVTPTSTARATPSPSPTETVLYQADWSHRLAGWRYDPGWKIVQGQLQMDSVNESSITAPYMPKGLNYAFEARLRIVRAMHNGGEVQWFAPALTGRDGYRGGLNDIIPRGGFFHCFISAFIEPMTSIEPGSYGVSDCAFGSDWYTFRIEVRGSAVRFFVDGAGKGRSYSEKTPLLSNQVGLICSDVVLQVSSFRIMSL